MSRMRSTLERVDQNLEDSMGVNPGRGVIDPRGGNAKWLGLRDRWSNLVSSSWDPWRAYSRSLRMYRHNPRNKNGASPMITMIVISTANPPTTTPSAWGPTLGAIESVGMRRKQPQTRTMPASNVKNPDHRREKTPPIKLMRTG